MITTNSPAIAAACDAVGEECALPTIEGVAPLMPLDKLHEIGRTHKGRLLAYHWEEAIDLVREVEAHHGLTAAPVAQLSEPPEGWKLVPIEPTIEMCEAGKHAELFSPSARSSLVVYRAMVRAAPTTPKDAS